VYVSQCFFVSVCVSLSFSLSLSLCVVARSFFWFVLLDSLAFDYVNLFGQRAA